MTDSGRNSHGVFLVKHRMHAIADRLRSSPLRVEFLEDRLTPATITVTTTSDALGVNSLREAINSINAHTDTNAAITANRVGNYRDGDAIHFNIPGVGVRTIQPTLPLPALKSSVTIDGYTQPGSSPNNATSGTNALLLIELDGTFAGNNRINTPVGGLTINIGSNVFGLVINRFNGSGLVLRGAAGSTIAGNFIGTNAAGTVAMGNLGQGGVVLGADFVGANRNIIGGITPATVNLISGNVGSGVVLSKSQDNLIEGNLIGTNALGTAALGNGSGVDVGDSRNNVIGGTTSAARNLISGNGGSGVSFFARIVISSAANNVVQGNFIGTDVTGTAPVPNTGDGVRIFAGQERTFVFSQTIGGMDAGTGNTIAFNTGNGVAVGIRSLQRDRPDRNAILGNSIFRNGGLGIDLGSDGVTPNAPGLRNGPNGLQNYPVLTAATVSGGSIVIDGTLNSLPNTSFRVELFGNPAADPSSFGEGKTFLGSVDVTTDSDGNAVFHPLFPVVTPFGLQVSATATNLETRATSEFSRNKMITFAPIFATGADAGGGPRVNVYDATTGELMRSFYAFDPSFTGGVRVAVGDVNGDGVPDIIAGAGPGGGPHVRVFDSQTGLPLTGAVSSFFAYDLSFTGGVFVATGDINGDGFSDLIITPDEGGGPRVRIFSGADFVQLADFFGIDDSTFRGGARASTGDINGDGRTDLIVAAGSGGGPRVAAFDGKSVGGTLVKLFGDFFAFEPELRSGAFVTAGDLNGDGFAEIIVGAGPGGGPRITAFSGQSLLTNTLNPVANFFAGNVDNRGGMRVTVKNLDEDNRADLVVGDGIGAGSRVTAFRSRDITASGTPTNHLSFDAFDNFAGGVFVG